MNASFDVSRQAGCSPLFVLFSNTSTGNPDSCRWDFGNGNISIACSGLIYATYTEPGNYNVSLRIYKNGQSSIASKTITVFRDPVAKFTASDRKGCLPFTTGFTEQLILGDAPIAERLWTFGDGRQSNLANPTYTYTNRGDFSVGLIVIDANGCRGDTVFPAYISTENFPVSAFTLDKKVACSVPFQVNFTDISQSLQPLAYSWNFGDGGTSTSANPSHTFQTPGTYSVRLEVTNQFGCKDDTAIANTFTLENFAPTIQVNDSVGCAPFNLTFSAQSSIAVASHQWSLSGGNIISSQQGDSYLFDQPGNYVLTLDAVSANGCTSRRTKTIRVNPSPTAEFSAAPREACSAPLQVTFTNQSQGAATYSWNFGNGATSTSTNPTANYTSPGIYSVSLTAISDQGCSNTKVVDSMIVIGEPSVSIVASPSSGCAPFTTSFSIDKRGPGNITNISWDFGNGNTFTGISPPAQTYSSSGNYAVNAVVSFDGGCPQKVVNYLLSTGTPPSGFIPVINANSVCVKKEVNFSVTGGNPGTTFLWDFGNGESQSGRNASFAYPTFGNYAIRLNATLGGCDTTVSVGTIEVKPPAAAFMVTGICSGLTLRFQNQSGSRTTSIWNFGDGSPVVSNNDNFVNHTFPGNGIYNVRLTVSNSTTGCTDTLTKPVDLRDFRPNVSIPPQTGCAPFTVNFNDTNSVIKSIQWDLGDTIISRRNFSYTFTKGGLYTIKVYTIDQQNCRDTFVFKDIIKVVSLQAGFTFNPPGGCAPITIQFNDTSQSTFSNIQQWNWNFGGLGTSSLKSPQFTFDANDTLNIRLIVTDNLGCSATVTRRVFITNPKAAFTSDFQSICTGTPIQLRNKSTGVGLSYEWKFGNGTTSTDKDPLPVFYQTGLYSVQLKVTDTNNCKDSLVANNYITVENFNYDFGVNTRTKPCPPLLANFSILPSDIPYNKAFWYFGDGNKSEDSLRFPVNLYADAGKYDVRLVLEDYRGCRDTVEKKGFIEVQGPSGSYTVSPEWGCVPLDVRFDATFNSAVSLFWDLGDGTGIVDTQLVRSFNHTYLSASPAATTMFLTDAGNCQVVKKGPVIMPSETKARPVADKLVACNDEKIRFRDLSITQDYAPFTQRLWDFGDGTSSTDSVVEHSFRVDTTRSIFVRLTVTNAFGCSNTDSVEVIVYRIPPLVTDGNKKICNGDKVQLNASGVTNYQWSPGNSLSNPLIANPVASPVVTTTYIVKGYDIERCLAFDTVVVTVVQKVEAVAKPDTTICLGDTLQLRVETDGISSGQYVFRWEPPELYTNPNIPNPTVVPTSDQVYTVTVSNGQCQDAVLPVFVRVKPTPLVTADSIATVISGGEVRLHAFSDGPVQFRWFPDLYLSCSDCHDPIARPPASILYRVTGTAPNGCDASASVFVRVLENCSTEAVDMPNIFSPNGDGHHDVFKVRGTGIKEMISLNIFSRNGEKLFESNSINIGWDGTYNGVPVNTGVYVYYAEIICLDGQRVVIKGNVTLVR